VETGQKFIILKNFCNGKRFDNRLGAVNLPAFWEKEILYV
jgi:hypothetical protein